MLCCHFIFVAFCCFVFFFFFNDTATTEIYTLSLHDALPIWPQVRQNRIRVAPRTSGVERGDLGAGSCESGVAASRDRKSTRLNSSHSQISYAVFCLKKKKKKNKKTKKEKQKKQNKN